TRFAAGRCSMAFRSDHSRKNQGKSKTIVTRASQMPLRDRFRRGGHSTAGYMILLEAANKPMLKPRLYCGVRPPDCAFCKPNDSVVLQVALGSDGWRA